MSRPVWLLSTKGRPQGCQEVLDACEATGMRSRGIVWVDETVDAYQGIRLPPNWKIIYRKRWGGIAAGMNWVFKRFPTASQYGWLSDDAVPRTANWDAEIERAAGDWFLAYGDDLYVSANPAWVGMLYTGADLGAPLCWGGELVRAVGWWALPGVRQAGIDTAWCAIVNRLGLYSYRTDIVCEHKNYRTGKRAYDDTDSWERNGFNFIQADLEERERWHASDEYPDALERVGQAMKRAGVLPPGPPPSRPPAHIRVPPSRRRHRKRRRIA